MPLLGVLVALTLAVAGCSTSRSPDAEVPAAVPTPAETIVHDGGSGGPGSFHVRFDEKELLLAPTSWCWTNACADGHDPNPPSVGSPEALFVFVPITAFDSLYAGQRSGEDYCTARATEAEVTDLGGGWWQVLPRGEARSWIIDLFATGSDPMGGSGDMAATLIWETPTDRPLPEPAASLVVIADHDGEPDSYGLEFSVRDLAETPEDVTATITVTADDGDALTFDATRSTDCAGEGALWFDGPADKALEASTLGDFPFTYDVTLTLDGVAHTATGVYPDDVASEFDLAVPLEFTPALH